MEIHFLSFFFCASVCLFVVFFFLSWQAADTIKFWKGERVLVPENAKDRLILDVALHVDISQLIHGFIVDFS